MSGGEEDLGVQSRLAAGDEKLRRQTGMRVAAAKAFFEVDCQEALRRATLAGPRPKLDSYEVGQNVFYWRHGGRTGKKDPYACWHGPARVVMTNYPTTVWLSHGGRLVKAAP